MLFDRAELRIAAAAASSFSLQRMPVIAIGSTAGGRCGVKVLSGGRPRAQTTPAEHLGPVADAAPLERVWSVEVFGAHVLIGGLVDRDEVEMVREQQSEHEAGN
eukprot:CAMPEP_0119362290 /NCGR_PEP_ID=MMETSP1334-20130426/9392_1 /TAXON_ID=127549 /ORGANISM="Calcidiscus leptoporus, Strain RCC1130" /LENGTH=103 /DNA_ID=CAMNT_0007377483 /DNA_START=374 /DNA_END=685 /DNA_ORIENTATION=+